MKESTQLVRLRAMKDESRIRELLEEILNSESTPEQVCAEFPELLPEVRNRWRRIQRVARQLDALFPPSSAGKGAVEKAASQPLRRELPEIGGAEFQADGPQQHMAEKTRLTQPVGALHGAAQWARRRPVAAAILVAVVAALALVLAAVFGLREKEGARQNEEPRREAPARQAIEVRR